MKPMKEGRNMKHCGGVVLLTPHSDWYGFCSLWNPSQLLQSTVWPIFSQANFGVYQQQEWQRKTYSTVLPPLLSLKLKEDLPSVKNLNSSNKEETSKLANSISWTKIPASANHPATADDMTRDGDLVLVYHNMDGFGLLPQDHELYHELIGQQQQQQQWGQPPLYTYSTPVLVPSFPGSGSQFCNLISTTMLSGFGFDMESTFFDTMWTNVVESKGCHMKNPHLLGSHLNKQIHIHTDTTIAWWHYN
jgi:hypothetical protein